MNTQRLILPSFNFVTDNFYDFVRETNFGNALGSFLIHEIPGKNVPLDSPERGNRNMITYDIREFIELANRNLGINNKVTATEIAELLLYHSPDFYCSRLVENFQFQVNDTGNILPTDPHIQRICDVYNAYAYGYNSKHNLNTNNSYYKSILIPQNAADNAILQDANIDYEGKTINVHNLLNMDIVIQDPFRKNVKVEMKSMVRGLFSGSTSLFTLSFLSNFLTDSHDRMYFHTDLLDRYFNDGDEEYIQGKSVGYWFNGVDLTYTPAQEEYVFRPEIERRVNELSLPHSLRRQINSRTQNYLKSQMIDRIVNYYSSTPETLLEYNTSRLDKKVEGNRIDRIGEVQPDEEMDILDAFPGTELRSRPMRVMHMYKPYVNDHTPYGISRVAVSTLSKSLDIPPYYLTEDTANLLNDKDLRSSVRGFENYVSILTSVYHAYQG